MKRMKLVSSTQDGLHPEREEKKMDRMFRFVGITVVAVLVTISVFAAGAVIVHEFSSTTLAASPAEKAQEASKNEAESRKEVVNEVGDVKAALDSMQGNLEKGNAKAAQTDAKRL